MIKSKAVATAVGIALVIAIGAIAGRTANASHVSPVGLGTAASFAILAGQSITDVPTSVITGDVGLSPATGAQIGLICTQVAGTIYSVDAAGPLPCRVTNPGLLTTAKQALSDAIGDAATRSGGLPVTANQLAGQILPHGVYNSAAAMDLASGGELILDGGGDPNAVFIFQLGTLLTVNDGSRITLRNQAQACNVFWKVDSADIGTTATFRGTILAETSISVRNGSTIDGRLLAFGGSVTLINDTIIRPSTCLTAIAPVPPTRPPFTIAPSAAPTAAPTTTPIGTPAPTATPVGAATPAVAPTATPGTAATPTVAVVQTLPSTSTNAPLDRLLMLLIALAGVGTLVLRPQSRN
jgi:hypothetical protein